MRCHQHIVLVSVKIAVYCPPEAHPETDRAFVTVHARLAAQPRMTPPGNAEKWRTYSCMAGCAVWFYRYINGSRAALWFLHFYQIWRASGCCLGTTLTCQLLLLETVIFSYELCRFLSVDVRTNQSGPCHRGLSVRRNTCEYHCGDGFQLGVTANTR